MLQPFQLLLDTDFIFQADEETTVTPASNQTKVHTQRSSVTANPELWHFCHTHAWCNERRQQDLVSESAWKTRLHWCDKAKEEVTPRSGYYFNLNHDVSLTKLLLWLNLTLNHGSVSSENGFYFCNGFCNILTNDVILPTDRKKIQRRILSSWRTCCVRGLSEAGGWLERRQKIYSCYTKIVFSDISFFMVSYWTVSPQHLSKDHSNKSVWEGWIKLWLK